MMLRCVGRGGCDGDGDGDEDGWRLQLRYEASITGTALALLSDSV